jgi:hypothetical protein
VGDEDGAAADERPRVVSSDAPFGVPFASDIPFRVPFAC